MVFLTHAHASAGFLPLVYLEEEKERRFLHGREPSEKGEGMQEQGELKNPI